MKTNLIVITPVRNEAWVLDAFLTHTSSWADYIILADQHSTDGTRDIIARYPKAILIDNPTVEWHENIVRAELLRNAASIPGDKIIFGMDADEFMSDGFEKTEGWKRIMESNPNTIFCFRWLNLFDDFHHVEYYGQYAEWACHFDDSIDIVAEYEVREKNAVHCSRVPCLDVNRAEYVNIDDIRFVHLAKLNKIRTLNKLDFYQVTWVDKNPGKWNPISFYRSYAQYYPDGVVKLDKSVKLKCSYSDRVVNDLVRTSDHGQHYVDEMIAVFNREGTTKFLKLNIWNNPYLLEHVELPHRPLFVRLIHKYLRVTQPYHDFVFIKYLDKVLKRLLS